MLRMELQCSPLQRHRWTSSTPKDDRFRVLINILLTHSETFRCAGNINSFALAPLLTVGILLPVQLQWECALLTQAISIYYSCCCLCCLLVIQMWTKMAKLAKWLKCTEKDYEPESNFKCNSEGRDAASFQLFNITTSDGDPWQRIRHVTHYLLLQRGLAHSPAQQEALVEGLQQVSLLLTRYDHNLNLFRTHKQGISSESVLTVQRVQVAQTHERPWNALHVIIAGYIYSICTYTVYAHITRGPQSVSLAWPSSHSSLTFPIHISARCPHCLLFWIQITSTGKKQEKKKTFQLYHFSFTSEKIFFRTFSSFPPSMRRESWTN